MPPEMETTQDFDVDQILADVSATEHDPEPRAMSAPASEPAPVTPQEKEYEFNSRGQMIKIKENDPRLSQWLSQGHDYAQSISQLKADQEALEQQKQEYETKYSPYKKVDEFAAANPEWWRSIQQNLQMKQTIPVDIPDQLKPFIEPIIKDYADIKKWQHQTQTEKLEADARKANEALDAEIKSIGQKNNLDFSQKDGSGQSLESRVILHAKTQGISTFQAAFRDYYHDQLVMQAEARGKESIAKDMENKRKLGLLGESSTPSKGVHQVENVRSKSWNDIHQEALRELNLN